MIEISHRQARYLLRESLDARSGDGRRLPEEQWTALQAHLEGCDECRAYRDRAVRFERSVQRVLAARWHAVPGPQPDLPLELIAARWHARERRRRAGAVVRNIGYAGLAALVLLGLFLAGRSRSAQQPAAPQAEVQPAAPTPTPTPAARFEGVVLFAGKGEASDDIFLLQSGLQRVDLSNLTVDAAHDSHPSWSPDGEWIAFLSDRSGKAELHVMTIAGSRITQLTEEPEITWVGPLAWSPDGQWIALTGQRREQENAAWLYLVPVGGKNAQIRPIPVPETRELVGPARFYRDIDGALSLFFQPYGQAGVISRYRLETGLVDNLTGDEITRSVLRAAGEPQPQPGELPEVLSFDFTAQASLSNLVYLDASATGEQGEVVELRRLSSDARGVQRSFTIDSGLLEEFRDVSLIPGAAQVAYLRKTDPPGCWQIHLRALSLDGPPRVIDGLCVESGLEPGQWSASGGWVTVTGRRPGDDAPSLFAVRVLPDGEIRQPVLFPFGDTPAVTGPALPRPSADRLRINPVAALRPVQSRVPTASAPATLTGRVVASISRGSGWSEIVSMRPDGTDRRVLVPADAKNDCPALSPDGAFVAYLSDREAVTTASRDLYLQSTGQAAGSKLVQPNLIYNGYSRYDCPSWSPDGTRIAAVVHAFGMGYLVVFPLDGGEAIYQQVDPRPQYALPVWSPDSRTIYLSTPRRMGFAPQVTAYRITGQGQVMSSTQAAMVMEGWDDIPAMAVSPDGRQLALLLVRELEPGDAQAPTAELRVINISTTNVSYAKDLNGYRPGGQARAGRIFWLPDRQIVFAFFNQPLTGRQAAIVRYDPLQDVFQFLALSQDALYDWYLSGDWLVYSTESGLWGDRIEGRFDSATEPVWLSGDRFRDLDWK